MYKVINKHLEKIAICVVIIGILWVFFGPILITQQTSLWHINYGGEDHNTGVIGDTIGGITAPVVGIVSIILLYLALIKQIESNQVAVHESNFRLVYSEINELKKTLEKFVYRDQTGKEAISFLARDFEDRFDRFEKGDIENLRRFFLLLGEFNKIFYLLDNLNTSIQYKDILIRDFRSAFESYMQLGYSTIQTWPLNEVDFENPIKSMMHIIKQKTKVIFEEILKTSRLISKEIKK